MRSNDSISLTRNLVLQLVIDLSRLVVRLVVWTTRWVDENLDDNNAAADENSLWGAVDEAIGAIEHLRGRHLYDVPPLSKDG
jgi:hypothetical protein